MSKGIGHGPVLFSTLLVLALISLLSVFVAHDYLPLVDLPNHMARHYIAANPDTALSAYYSYEFAFTSNAAADLPWLWFAADYMTPTAYARLIFGLYALLILSASIALSYVFWQRVSIWTLAVVALVFNEVYFWGFQNFLLTVPCALLALALWLRCEPWPGLSRALLFLPISLVLFEMHLLGWFVFAVTCFGREIQRLMPIESEQSFCIRLWRGGVHGIPFLPPVFIVIYRSLTHPPNEFGTQTYFGNLGERLQQLYSLVNVTTAEDNLALHMVSLCLLLGFLAAIATLVKTNGARLVVADKARGPLIALLIATILMPVGLTGVWFVHIRFPFALAVLFIASTVWRDGKRPYMVTITLAVIALITIRTGLIHLETFRYSQDTKALIHLSKAIPEGARILPVRASAVHDNKVDWHRQAYALMAADAFVPTLFLGAHAMQLKPEWRDIAMAQGRSLPTNYVFDQKPLNWDGESVWPREDAQLDRFTHLLALDEKAVPGSTPSYLTEIAANGRYRLYEIRFSQPDYIPAQPVWSGRRLRRPL